MWPQEFSNLCTLPLTWVTTPRKSPSKDKRPLYTCFKRKRKKNSKSWLLISNALWDRSSSKGGNVKINKGRHHYTGVRSPAGGALTDTPLTHIQIPTETYLVSLVGSDTTIASRRKKNFPLPGTSSVNERLSQLSQYKKSANTKNHYTLNSQFPPIDILFITGPPNFSFSIKEFPPHCFTGLACSSP